MDLQANKTDGKVLPLSNRRISAEEWNQLAASCMAFITAAGLTPDALDNEQLLNAFKAIAADLELVGANTNLSNLTSSGQAKFDTKAGTDLSNVTSSGKSTATDWMMPDYSAIVSGLSFPYTAPKNGLLSFNCDESSSGILTINGNSFNIAGNDSPNEGPVQILVSKDDVISFSSANYFNLIFIPMKGAN